MAVITSTTTGNFSAGATWVGGIVPGPADDAVAATGTVVTIDTNVTVISFQQAGTGKFVLGGGRTVFGNVIANAGTFTGGGTVEVTAGVGQTATITGNVTGVSSTANNIAGIVVTGVGTLVLNGTVTGSAGNGASQALGSAGVYTNATSTITINGAVTGGTGANKRGFQSGASSNGTFTIVGDINGGTTSATFGALTEGSTPTLTIIGNVVASVLAAGGNGVQSLGTSTTLTITGNVTGGGAGNNGTAGVFVTGATATVTITGNVTGPSAANSNFGVTSSGSNAVVTIVGIVTGGGGAAGSWGAYTTGPSATMTITGQCVGGGGGSAFGAVSGGASSTVNVIGSVIGVGTLSHGINSSATSNGVIFEGNLTDSLQGATAIYTRRLRVTATNTGVTTYTNTVGYPTGTPVSRVSPDNVTGMASPTNVRSGIVYGFNNELTGTVAIPAAGSVALGAEVDNTTGTATLDAGTVIAVVGQQVAAASSSPSVV